MTIAARNESPHDRERLAHVQPSDWVDPEPCGKYHLVVLGAGTAGLVAAAGAAGLGAKVALVERAAMGGDCLNVGCVPSKAILASARAAAAVARSGDFGLTLRCPVTVDFAAVMERMRRLRAGIAPHDGARRFRELGVDVFLGAGRFVSPTAIAVDGRVLRFARAVVATGGRPAVPDVPGLAAAGFHTNETIFDLVELPRRLAVVGGGPIGCELAQAFARLGAQVTLVQRAQRLLPRDDPDAAEIVLHRFTREGIGVRLEVQLERVEVRDGAKVLYLRRRGLEERVTADAVLIAAGRRPNVEDLGLERAGISFDALGVAVDDHLRTTNRRVFAAGDVALRQRFTHVADPAARIVVQNALFPFRRRASALTIPWCTYTEPEVAHVGLGEVEARARGLAVETVTVPFAEVDRARLDDDSEGFVRLHVEAKKGRILGATIVGRDAGELVSEVSVAMAGRLPLGALANVIHPYPTRAEALRKAGDAWNRRRLTPFAKRLLGRWLRMFA
jgi:pyruvate/2-oxoglutarate dehydrogenase complex dihydrolipoamide dehydrogenase (E3) component